MKCYNCGKVVKKYVNFCPDCGACLTNYEENQKMIEGAKDNEEIAKQIKNKDGKPKRTDKLGLAGFIVALCGLCTTSFVASIVGLVFSAVSMKSYDETRNKNKGFAVAGLVLGIIGLIASIAEGAIKRFL